MYFKSSLWFLYDNIVGLKWIINKKVQAIPPSSYYFFSVNIINAVQV